MLFIVHKLGVTETALTFGINNIISRLICTRKLFSIASTSGQ